MQASIVIITTAAGKLQDDTASDSLDNAVTLWLVYACISVVISGALLIVSRSALLPAARLSQVVPARLGEEVARLARRRGRLEDANGELDLKKEEKLLKAPIPGHENVRWLFLAACVLIIVIGWIMFGMGVSWGVHGSVIAGTVGE